MQQEPLQKSDYRDHDAKFVVELDATAGNLQGVLDRLNKYGFAIASLENIPGDPEQKMQKYAELLNLKEPYVPALYRNTASYRNDKYVNLRSGNDEVKTVDGCGFHVDGLLEPIGEVRTAFVYCVRPAVEGGDTIILNSAGLYLDLLEQDPKAAECLTDPSILHRRSMYPGIDGTATGPAFGFDCNGELVNRYSDSACDDWTAPSRREEQFQKALSFFREHGSRDGQRRITIPLEAGECLIMRNDKVSHAVDSFRDDPNAPRHLVRALFLGGIGCLKEVMD